MLNRRMLNRVITIRKCDILNVFNSPDDVFTWDRRGYQPKVELLFFSFKSARMAPMCKLWLDKV